MWIRRVPSQEDTVVWEVQLVYPCVHFTRRIGHERCSLKILMKWRLRSKMERRSRPTVVIRMTCDTNDALTEHSAQRALTEVKETESSSKSKEK
jgi:hypothetical protein